MPTLTRNTYVVGDVELLDEIALQEHADGGATRVVIGQLEICVWYVVVRRAWGARRRRVRVCLTCGRVTRASALEI